MQCHMGGERTACVTIGQHHIVIAGRALRRQSHRKYSASAAGRPQHGLAVVFVENSEELGVPARLIFGHQAFEPLWIRLLQCAPYGSGTLRKREIHLLVNRSVDQTIQHREYGGEGTAYAQDQTNSQTPVQ